MRTEEMAEELAYRDRNERERRGLPPRVSPPSRHPGEMQADWAVDAMRAAADPTIYEQIDARVSVKLTIKPRGKIAKYFEEVWLGDTYLGYITTARAVASVEAVAVNGNRKYETKDVNGVNRQRWQCIGRLRRWLLEESVK